MRKKQLWVEAVQQFGAKAAEKALALMNTQVDEETEQILADILCQWPLEGAFERLSALFCQANPEHKAFYASCLGKLGDERAVEMLTKQLKRSKAGLLYLLRHSRCCGGAGRVGGIGS